MCLREKCWPRSSHSTPFSFIFICLFSVASAYFLCVLLLGRKNQSLCRIFLVLSPSNVCSSLGMEPASLSFFSKGKDTGGGGNQHFSIEYERHVSAFSTKTKKDASGNGFPLSFSTTLCTFCQVVPSLSCGI